MLDAKLLKPILHVNNKSFNYQGIRETGPRLVVKDTWLLKGLCLTTPDDCRRQLKNWVFSLSFSCLDIEHFVF